MTVRVIDWKDPLANDFLVASQVWVEGVLHKRRPDTIGFVNGLPLLLAEWKAPTCPLADAYEKNLRDYRDTVPRLFDANGFVLLSNGLESVMGASHAPYDFYAPWKKLDEGGPEDASLETMLRATCEPARFLDLIESFILFDEVPGGLRKIIGKYHQVLGVNRAIQAVEHIADNQGKLGVFWHTQGSGKSLSMVMFAEKVLRRLGGNYTFVIVTDRTEPKLTRAQEAEVKAVARRLLERLEELVMAVNWTGNQQSRGAVWSEIRQKLNDLPEDPYPQDLWDAKVHQVWDFVLTRYAAAQGSRPLRNP